MALPLVGCSGCGGEDAEVAATSGATTGSPGSPRFDQALHDELMEMLERDQGGRTGGPDPEATPSGRHGRRRSWSGSRRIPANRRRTAPRSGGAPTARYPAPLADETGVDARRAEAGLDPMADHLVEMATVCAGD